ncbi:uncharacterized protein LY89DRAFT_728672 [Mollisia scopiformis]|uniref:Uncharacterized protein n=1 Tax=Mollisia scopiformis TaxID=149040 RepID=A0A194XQT4_MOLSC|nr:uncharacterized protein LY89DRAFT_728672 [Mollisia scopiformis]KUJ22538.1 hypothetical protein LY89DRAFT_728672 [Mollisia scopiformis]
MLLPSAIGCESSSSSSSSSSLPKPYYQPTTLFASPPISPPSTSHSNNNTSSTNTTISSLYSTCRALQSMLSPPPTHLPSPPTHHLSTPIIASPLKLKLRTRGIKNEPADPNPNLTPRKKITKRTPVVAPRGINKRRRALLDDSLETGDSEDEQEQEQEQFDGKENLPIAQHQQQVDGEEEQQGPPRTPKRLRLAPEILPLGLARSDFHALHLQHQLSSQPLQFPPSSSSSLEQRMNGELEEEEEGEGEWTIEDDRLLVELVLEKLKLRWVI